MKKIISFIFKALLPLFVLNHNTSLGLGQVNKKDMSSNSSVSLQQLPEALKKNLLFVEQNALFRSPTSSPRHLFHQTDINYHDLEQIMERALQSGNTTKMYKPSFTFMSVDLKFTEAEEIKILEFNGGKTSGSYGHAKLYGPGKIWAEFWSQIERIGLPPFLVSLQQPGANSGRHSFDRIGGVWSKKIADLVEKQSFTPARVIQNPETLADYDGLVISRYRERIKHNFEAISDFKENFPNYVIIDEMSQPYQRNKIMMGMLFEKGDLEIFRPKYKSYLKKFDPNLVAQIQNDFSKASRVVIKPFDSTQGIGIIITEKKNLEKVLRAILNGEKLVSPNPDINKKDLKYWETDRNDVFLIEEFVTSKKVYVHGKPYDPTMRVFCSVKNDTFGNFDVSLWGYYWKLPVYPTSAPVGFSEKHKSNIHHGVGSARVSSDDKIYIHKVLTPLLERLYQKMHLVDQEVQAFKKELN